MKVTIKNETVKTNGHFEYVADGEMNGVPVQVFARSNYSNSGLAITLKTELGRRMTVEEYAAIGVALDLTGIEDTFKAAIAEIAKAAEEAKQAELREKRKSAYADSIHTVAAVVLENAGFKTNKQSFDEFVDSPRNYLKATKNGESVEVFEDKKFFVVSIGYSRDDRKKTSKIDKLAAIADEMIETKRMRKERDARTKKAKEDRESLVMSIIGEGASINYSGIATATLKSDIEISTAGKRWDNKFEMSLHGLTEEQARAVVALVRGM